MAVASLALHACRDTPPPHVKIPDLNPAELSGYGGELDGAVIAEGRVIPEPQDGPQASAAEAPMQAGDGDGQAKEDPGRRSPSFRPDRVTELEGTLGYYSVFTPSIAPFKRVSAMDGVVMLDDTPVLGVSDNRRREVPVEGRDAPAPDARPRDRFWGSVVLDFSEGKVVPLPSVSPESRVLSLRTEPQVKLRVTRDGADNFFVEARGLPPRRVRVVYMMDAPRSYFGASLPDSRADALSGELFGLPPVLRPQAAAFAREMGVAADMPASTVLTKLAAHFRAFKESKRPPAASGDGIFLDLARARLGVCRHRAYAFVITAQGLGIPTRFVQNEAHAWVEVKLASRGWMRLDLGGAANGLDARGLSDRPAYRAPVVDPWPRPREFEESYSAAAQAGGGPRSDQGSGSGLLQRGGVKRRPGDGSLRPTLARGQGDAVLDPGVFDDREPVTLRVTSNDSEVLRGHMLAVSGIATAARERPVAGLRVEVSLAQPQGEQAVLLGVAVTDSEGRFEASFAVPPDLDPADYALVVVTPGDSRYGAARAD